MNISELRHGSLLWSKKGKRVFAVNLNEMQSIKRQLEAYDAEPIVLTANFVSCFHGTFILEHDCIQIRTKSKFIDLIPPQMLGPWQNSYCWMFNDGREFVELPYIHTLQNLYVLLAGEELELKPNINPKIT